MNTRWLQRPVRAAGERPTVIGLHLPNPVDTDRSGRNGETSNTANHGPRRRAHA